MYREPNYKILRMASHPEPDGEVLLEMRQPFDDDPELSTAPAYVAIGWWGDNEFQSFDKLLIYSDQAGCDADWQRLVSDPDASFSKCDGLRWIERIEYGAIGYRQDGTQIHYKNVADESASDQAPAPIASFCKGQLFRARVCLPITMIEEFEPIMDRMVFFVALNANERTAIIEALIAKAWNIDTNGWVDDGCIYDVTPVAAIRSHSRFPAPASDIQLFEDGLGGDMDQAIGPERIRYARARDVDLLVSPPISSRLHDALDAIEVLFAEQANKGGFYRRAATALE